MNNLEVILESIISEGKTESKQILDDANYRASDIVGESRKEAEKKARDIIDSANKEAKNLIENEATSTNRQARDIEISAKNKVIDNVVDQLIKNLENIDADTYIRFVENTLSKANLKNGEILLAEGLKDAVKDHDFNGLKVSDHTVENGFVVKSGKIEYDNRFSSLVKYNIDDIRREISKEIFKWGK